MKFVSGRSSITLYEQTQDASEATFRSIDGYVRCLFMGRTAGDSYTYFWYGQRAHDLMTAAACLQISCARLTWPRAGDILINHGRVVHWYCLRFFLGTEAFREIPSFFVLFAYISNASELVFLAAPIRPTLSAVLPILFVLFTVALRLPKFVVLTLTKPTVVPIKWP